jgi:hypothetical protein
MRAINSIQLITYLFFFCQGVFGLSEVPIPSRRPTIVHTRSMKRILMNSLKVRTQLEDLTEDEANRYQVLGTFWKKNYSIYIWDKVENTIRIARGPLWKTIIDLKDKTLRGFGLTKNGLLIVLTEQTTEESPNSFTLGVHRNNGRRQTHLNFSSYLEHNNLTLLEFDFPNFYLLQGDFTTEINNLGRSKKVFLGDPLYGNSEDEQLSIHVSLAGDHMVIQARERYDSERGSRNSPLSSTIFSFNKEQRMDHISATHRFKGQVLVVLEGEVNDDLRASYYELHFDRGSSLWLSNRSVEMDWIDSEHRQFWFYNNKLYMTEISGQHINTYRFK